MTGTEGTYSITRIAGDVLLHHDAFGWVRAEKGMEFSQRLRITTKTGVNGLAEILNAEGSIFQIPPRSLRLIDGQFSEDNMDTLRFMKLGARDMKAASISKRLDPAA